MKIKLSLLIVILLFPFEQVSTQTHDGNSWFWQYPKPQGNTLRDIYIFDSTTAIAIGDLGTVIKTYDGGENWDVQHHAGGTDIDLYSVHFTDTLNGWTAGGIWYTNKNVLLKTGNGGKTWTEVKTDTTLPYNSVYFVDADTGFVFGEDGIILRTTDRGNSWDTRSIDNYIGYYLDVFRFIAVTFTDKQTGFLVGAGYYGNEIYKTTDCGKTWMWDEHIITPKFYGSINDICFVNKNNGFITGDMGCFAKTTDGGATWQYQNLWEKYQKEKYQYFYSVFFTDTLKGWIVGSGFILETIDGGDNWTEIWTEQQFGSVFYKVRFANNDLNSEQTGWSAGSDGMIYQTTDTGENWVAQRDEKYGFRSIYFIDENTGWAVGDSGVIMHTENGGTNWYKQNQNNSLVLYSIYAIDTINIIAVGGLLNEQGLIKNAILLRTYDSSETWVMKTFADILLFNSIFFINDSTGWITGTGGTLIKTTDKGNTWNKITLDTNYANTTLGKIKFINNTTGWILFNRGTTLLKTVDSGKDWNVQVVDTNLSLTSFCFVNDKMGWTVGDYNGGNNILKTTDGGDNWIPCGSTTTDYNHSICFVNETTGWITGFKYINNRSVTIKTTDSGNTWFEQKSPMMNTSDIYFINDNTGWIVGDGIIKTTNGGGVVSVKDEWENRQNVPEAFYLYQNYPNPFNPATIIKYDLKESGFVSIKVYDILGREVIILVNEHQKTGSYSIKFNADGLSSGIYFYRLTTGNSVATNKMVVIR